MDEAWIYIVETEGIRFTTSSLASALAEISYWLEEGMTITIHRVSNIRELRNREYS